MQLASILLAWMLALASGWALFDARNAADELRAAMPVFEPRGAPLVAPRFDPNVDELEEVEVQPVEAAPAPQRVGDLWEVDFATLEFEDYDPPELRGEDAAELPLDAFPAAVRPLHGERVALTGFMQVTQFEEGRVKQFLLARYPSGCCFGGTPQYDEWIEVVLAKDAPTLSGARPVKVVGKLDVGEALSPDGDLTSLYRLLDARVE